MLIGPPSRPEISSCWRALPSMRSAMFAAQDFETLHVTRRDSIQRSVSEEPDQHFDTSRVAFMR